MTGYIYKTTNILTNKVYIGQKVGLPEKTEKYLGSGIRFRASLKSHGTFYFKKEILGIIKAKSKKELKEKLNYAETECIYFFRSFGADAEHYDEIYGYNMVKTGYGTLGFRMSKESKNKISCIHKGKPLSEKTKIKISKTKKGVPKSEEHKKKISNFMKGRPAWNKGLKFSEESKIKMSDAKKGEKNPMFGVPSTFTGKPSWNKGLTKATCEILKQSGIKGSQKLKGRQLTEEHKRKISEGGLGRIVSDETKEKIRKKNTGKTRSEETKKKMSKSHKGKKRKK